MVDPPVIVKILEVPTLSEWGLISMVVVIGVVAAVALHKRFATTK